MDAADDEPNRDAEEQDDAERMSGASGAAPRIKAQLGVVVLNYRTPDLVATCLQSIADELEAVDARVVVVDNASGDGSADRIAEFLAERARAPGGEWTGRAALVRAARNDGFSGGNNLGLSFLDAPLYLLLNSDAQATPGALSAMVAAAARHPQAGVSGPRLEGDDGAVQRSRFRFHTPLTEFLAGAQVSLFDSIFSFAIVAPPPLDRACDAQWVSFAAVLIRRETLIAAGRMDAGYFLYFEDEDFCRAARRAKWKAVYDPEARFVHLRGRSSPVKARMQAKERPPAYYYASRTRYFRKAFGPFGPTLANLAWGAGRVVAHARLLVGRSVPPACERQWSDQWINWRTPLGDRRAPGDG